MKINPTFPIVGIAASTDDKESLSQLFMTLPKETGAGFILIQPLDLKSEGLGPKTLSNNTEMPVLAAHDGMKIQPNHIYFNSPNSVISISNGKLKVSAITASSESSVTIKSFFVSLAQELNERAIAVILDGASSDSKDSLMVVNAGGGLCFAQKSKTSSSARYKLNHFSADFILTPEQIAEELGRVLGNQFLAGSHMKGLSSEALFDRSSSKETIAFNKILEVLRQRYLIDLQYYRRSILLRRLARRMLIVKIDNVLDYLSYLESQLAEPLLLLSDFLIHVTSFFRDPEIFSALRINVLPKLFEGHGAHLPFRAWVAGCSTGEEAYSLAITILEYLEDQKIQRSILIFATDISDECIKKARTGIYSEADLSLSKDRLERFFEKVSGGYQVKKKVRDLCVFSKHDLIRNAPYTNLDLISCRNVLIYLNDELKKRILLTFHYALAVKGILWLGPVENISGVGGLFSVEDKIYRFFRKKKIKTPSEKYFQIHEFDNKSSSSILSTKTELAEANEELQLENEELQSSQEELVSFRDELQVSNQELTNLNIELKLQNTAMMEQYTALTNIFGNTDIPIILVDCERRIKRFTPQAEKSFKILESDVGRKLSDLKIDIGKLNIDALLVDVIDTPETKEIQTQDSTGHWYQLNIKPFGTNTGKVEGAIIALIDIHKIKIALDTTTVAEKDLSIARADAFKIIEDNPIPLVVVKTNREVMLANRAFFEKFYPGVHVNGQASLSDLSRAELISKDLTSVIDKTLSEGIEFRNSEIQHRFPEVGVRDLILNTKRIELPGSGIQTALVAFEDVTEQRKLEAEKAMALDLLQQVSRRVPGLVFQYVLKPDGSFSFPFASEGISQIYRLSLADVREDASRLLTIIHPDDLDSLIGSFKKSANDLNPWSLEYRVKFSDGTIRWLLGNAVAERCINGDVLWSGYVSDITDRKKHEHELKLSEEKYRNLVTNAYEGVMILRQDGTIEFANQKLAKMFGYEVNELLNQKYDLMVDIKTRQKHQHHHENYMKKPAQRTMGQGLNLIGLRKDGSLFPIEVSLSPFVSNANTYVNCMVRDITDFKKLEETQKRLAAQERALRDEAIRSNRNKDEFLATLSHELRTPLTTILGWTQQLLMRNLDAEVREALKIVERSAKAQTQLVEDLLDISRIHAGKISLNIQVVDLAETLGSSISSVSVQAEKKKIHIETLIPPGECYVLADSFRLLQIFSNLLTNSVKFTPHGGKIFIKLEIIDSSKGNFARTSVTDTGMGIKPEFLPHVFERFSQVDTSMTRVYGGLGLGLAIVKSLVTQHRGTIEAHSEGSDKGSTFIVTLPMAKNKSIPTTTTKNIDGLPARLDGIKVLVVDDNADNLYLFDIILKSIGIEVQTAESVKECLEIFPIFRPDILVSDISMPGEDGYSLIRKIRNLEIDKGGTVPAIALTAYASPEDVRMALAAGYSGHVAKPVDKQVLAETIANLLKI